MTGRKLSEETSTRTLCKSDTMAESLSVTKGTVKTGIDFTGKPLVE